MTYRLKQPIHGDNNIIYEITTPTTVAPLFANWDETLIYSCLQDVVRRIYADELNHPTAVMAALGDFFYAGKPSVKSVSYKPDRCTQDFMIMVPQNSAWKDIIIQFHKNKATIISCYTIKKEPDIFDIPKLEKGSSSLPSGYELRMIDERLYHMCKSAPWSADLVSNSGIMVNTADSD